MRRLIKSFVIFFCFIIIQIGHASPDNSKWLKVDLIGTSGKSFFYYLSVQDHGFNSYYKFNTEIYIIRQNIESGLIQDKILLSKFQVNCHSDTLECKQTLLHKNSDNPITILEKHNVKHLYPVLEVKFTYKIDKQGLFYIANNKRINVVDISTLTKFMPNINEWIDSSFGNPKFVQGYSSIKYTYLLFTYGVGGDIDFYQALVPVKNK